jgi:hypothetical protein
VTFTNRSPLTSEEAAGVRKLLEKDLRGLGVISSNAESGTAIRVTLSANADGGLWVAEVAEGTEVRVAMVAAEIGPPAADRIESGIVLSKTLLWRQREPVLDVFMIPASGSAATMLVLEPERIVSYRPAAGPGTAAASWMKEREFPIPHERPFPRDIRGRLLPGAADSGHLFEAYLPGAQCWGTDNNSLLTVICEDGDDPWPILAGADSGGQSARQKAFYNSARNYFTGVLAPGYGLRLPAFYDAAAMPRPAGTALLLSALDGRVLLIENESAKRVSGTAEWGSDLAAVRSGCGSGTQVLVSAPGSGSAESVRAYEISGLEAAPVSAPLEMEGAETAMWSSYDEANATIVVRTEAVASGTGRAAEYEVYRVAAHCN